MWLLLELIIVVGLVGLIMLEVFDSSEREAIEAEGRRIAAVVGELQEGVDAYLADTGEIATCLNLRGVVTDWIDGVDARTRSGPSPSLRTLHGGNTPGREASVWHPVELFATAAAPLAPPTTSNFDGARRACNTGPGYLPSGTWYLPSLASAGLLPPALDGLRYSTDPSDEYWGRYSLRFRLWVRYVNAVPASTSPESGYKPRARVAAGRRRRSASRADCSGHAPCPALGRRRAHFVTRPLRPAAGRASRERRRRGHARGLDPRDLR